MSQSFSVSFSSLLSLPVVYFSCKLCPGRWELREPAETGRSTNKATINLASARSLRIWRGNEKQAALSVGKPRLPSPPLGEPR